MKYKRILAIDPSGSYAEGKGTTGWVLMNDDEYLATTGTIAATDYSCAEEYWNAHLQLIDFNYQKHGDDMIVVIEDYRLYRDRALNQSNSLMETCRLLGLIQWYCWRNQIRDDNGFMDFLCYNINKPNDVDLITDFLCDHVFVIKAKYLKDKLKERREFGHCDHLDYSDFPYVVNRGFKDIMGCYPGPHVVEWRCPYVNDEEFHRSTGSIC